MNWDLVIIFGSFVAIIIYVTSRRHSERIEMIRRGMNPAPAPPRVGGKALFLGLAGIAVGLALLVGGMVDSGGIDSDMLNAGLLCLFGGGALMLYWKLTAGDREQARRVYDKYLEQNFTPQKNTEPAATETGTAGVSENTE